MKNFVPTFIVSITKMDCTGVVFSEDWYNEIVDMIRDHLTSVGVYAVTFLPITN